MKLQLVAAMILLAGCASQSAAPPPPPSSPRKTTDTNHNTLSRDASDCERRAAASGAGNKRDAFDNCMKGRGYAPN